MDWIQKYWQLLFVGTISYIGGLAAPTIVKNFNRWIDLKSKIIKYNSLINHSFTEDEYNIFVYFGDKRFDLEADDGWGNGCYGGGFTVTVKKDEV